MRRRTPEGDWLYFVRASIRASLGYQAFLIKPPAGLGSYPGTSDLIGVVNGRGVALELKAPGGRYGVTANQENFLRNWRDAGGLGLVIASEEDLRGFLQRWKTGQGNLI